MCTPVGLSRMFTVMGQLLVKPTVSNHLDEVFTAFLKVESMEKSLLNSCCSDFFKKCLYRQTRVCSSCLKDVSFSHLKSQQRTTNTSPTHLPICHCSSPTSGLIITHFISSYSALSPLDPWGPGWADLLHPFAGGNPSEEIKRYVCGRRVGTL